MAAPRTLRQASAGARTLLLLDSNIIIHAAQPEHPELRLLIATHAPAVPAISYVEVLGYHGLTEQDRVHFEAFFAAATVLPITQAILDEAVRLLNPFDPPPPPATPNIRLRNQTPAPSSPPPDPRPQTPPG